MVKRNRSRGASWQGIRAGRRAQAAAAVGLLLPVDLGARGSAMPGGLAATNAGRNRVIRYGMMRDVVLGLEVVLAAGSSGARTHLDWADMFRGSGAVKDVGEPQLLIAFLRSRWTAPVEPDLLTFAAVTDDPPPKVAAVSHPLALQPEAQGISPEARQLLGKARGP